MASIAKIGYCRYEFLPILGSNTQIIVPDGWETPVDILYARLINFKFTYSWNGNTCTISDISWQPGYLTDAREFKADNLGSSNDTEFRQANKLTISFGGQTLTLTSSNNLIWAKGSETVPAYSYSSPITINSTSSYILANFKYEYSIASTSSKSGIKYYVEIKDIKIPKTSKYENNVVFTKEGIEELIKEVKNWPYSDTSLGTGAEKLRNQGTEIPANSNLDDYNIPGRYYSPNDVRTNSLDINSRPISDRGFTLHVFGNYNGAYLIQIITTSDQNIYYRVRSYTSSTGYFWRDWEKFATARNLTSLDHSLTLTTGNLTLSNGDTTIHGDLIVNDNRGTATTTNWSVFALGNEIATGTEKNSRGIIKLYSAKTGHHEIMSLLDSSSKDVYLQNYDGSQYLTHTGGATAVGSSTKPVYVAANGRITACDFSIDNLSDYVSDVKWSDNKLQQKKGNSYSNIVTAATLKTAVGFPSGNGTNGQFLKTDGSGGMSWATVSTTDTKNTAGASSQGNDSIYMIGAKGSSNSDSKTTYQSTSAYVTKDGYFYSTRVYNAVFNDYAEYRTTINLTPGHVVIDNDDGSLSCSSMRLQPGAQVISDTFGHSMGETDTAKTPLAVAGRVLVYPYQPRENYHAGMAVCSAPDGTVDIMTREEIRDYPDCIIGIVSEIPQYEVWGSDNVKVDGRIWIKVK